MDELEIVDGKGDTRYTVKDGKVFDAKEKEITDVEAEAAKAKKDKESSE